MDPSVDGAMRDFRRLDWTFMPLHVQRFCSRAAVLGPLGVALIDLLPKMKPIGEDTFDWAPVISLLQRPWFRRTWIIQEAVLARRAQIICGKQSVSWAVLERVVIAMNAYHGFVKRIPGYEKIHQTVRAVNLMRSARRDAYRHILMPEWWLVNRYIGLSRRECPKILDLVEESRGFACTNPRDKIYGMLGITDKHTQTEYLIPDYDSSPGDVFRKFVL